MTPNLAKNPDVSGTPVWASSMIVNAAASIGCEDARPRKSSSEVQRSPCRPATVITAKDPATMKV